MQKIKDIIFWLVMIAFALFSSYISYATYKSWIKKIADESAHDAIVRYVELERIGKEICERSGLYEGGGFKYLGNGDCEFIGKIE